MAASEAQKAALVKAQAAKAAKKAAAANGTRATPAPAPKPPTSSPKPAPKPPPKAIPNPEVLDGILEAINDAHGEGTALCLSDDKLTIHVPGIISSGEEALDMSLGRGGFPLGRIAMIAGDEGSGKTTLALSLCASVQRHGGIAFYIDAEYKLDRDYAAKLGVDIDTLAISQPPYLERAWEIIESAVNAARKQREATGVRVPILVILDSLNALPTKAELEGEHEDKHVGAAARSTSQSLKKLVRLISEEHVALIMISQLRQKIGVMFGDQESTAGGKAPRFYSTIIVNISPGAGVKEEVITEGKGKKEPVKVGHMVHVTVAKNQVAPPFKRCQLFLRYGEGFDRAHGIVEAAKSRGLIKESAGWLEWEGVLDARVQGHKGLARAMEADPSLEQKARGALREGYGWEE